jgi:tetratricopeptide (TPR) repeat protein
MREVHNSHVYTFIVDKSGEVIIPELKIKAGTKTAVIKDLKLTVADRRFTVASGANAVADKSLDELVFAKISMPVKRQFYYVGEDIPMQIKVYAAVNLNFSPSWPQIEIDNAVIKDFSAVNQENRNFRSVRRSVEKIEGVDYYVYLFDTSFRPLARGTISGTINVDSEIRVPEDRRRGDTDGFASMFFGRSRTRSISHPLKVEMPPLEIVPLPPFPTDSHYLGLVGNWHLSTSLKGDKIKVGETTTLTLKIKGPGSLETLEVPKLEIPGFRVYPPAIDKKTDPASGHSHADVSYVMIATSEGVNKVDVSFSFFSTISDSYKTSTVNSSILVEKSDSLTPAGDVFVGETETYVPEKRTFNPGILYLRRYPAGKIFLPLTSNHKFAYWILGVFGPLSILISWLITRRNRQLANDPLLRRRRDAVAARGVIIRRLRKAPAENIDQVIQQQVVPFVNDMLSLPPGTSASELAEKVDDNDMRECLKNSGEASYMPGSGSMDKHELKECVIKAVKRFSVILLLSTLSFSVNVTANETISTPVTQKIAAPVSIAAPITSAEEAMNAYDNGDFARAREYYMKQIDFRAPDPALLFNLGNCLCQEKDYALALVCYERAHRLAPGDSDIRENLNYVRRKLFLPEIGAIDNPLDLFLNLINTIRPDQWLLVTALCWFMFCLTMSMRQLIRGARRPLRVVFFLGILVSLTAAIIQYNTTYSGATAVITGKQANVYSLPSTNSGRVEFKLRNGELVKIIEQRSSWIRIRSDAGEGWVRAGELMAIWSDNQSGGGRFSVGN